MHYISYWGGRNHIAFVGDSRIRQLYFDFAGLLSNDEVKAFKAHSDLRHIDEKLSLEVVSLERECFEVHCELKEMHFVCAHNFDLCRLIFAVFGTFMLYKKFEQDHV